MNRRFEVHKQSKVKRDEGKRLITIPINDIQLFLAVTCPLRSKSIGLGSEISSFESEIDFQTGNEGKGPFVVRITKDLATEGRQLRLHLSSNKLATMAKTRTTEHFTRSVCNPHKDSNKKFVGIEVKLFLKSF